VAERSGELRVEQVAPARAFALRRAVLRPWLRLDELAADDEGAPTFAALAGPDEEVVGCATLFEEAAPESVPEAARRLPGFRLRSMATAPEHRGTGVGTAVLTAVLAEVARRGGGVLWCHARAGAVDFYSTMGLARAGAEFEIERIGVHVVMWCVVEAATG